MKKSHYCFIMGMIVLSPHMNPYLATALGAVYMALGLLSTNKE